MIFLYLFSGLFLWINEFDCSRFIYYLQANNRVEIIEFGINLACMDYRLLNPYQHEKIFLLALSSLIFAVSCSKDDGQGDGGDDNQPAVTLITPDVSVRIADPLSSTPLPVHWKFILVMKPLPFIMVIM